MRVVQGQDTDADGCKTSDVVHLESSGEVLLHMLVVLLAEYGSRGEGQFILTYDPLIFSH